LFFLTFGKRQLEDDTRSVCTVDDAETSRLVWRRDADQNVVVPPGQLSGTDVGRKDVFAGTNFEFVVQLKQVKLWNIHSVNKLSSSTLLKFKKWRSNTVYGVLFIL
jgi:hypothetical protein